MFHNDALPPVEEQLADPVVEPQQVAVRHSIPLPVPEPPDSLLEPDGYVHGQHLVWQGLHMDRLSSWLQQGPDRAPTHHEATILRSNFSESEKIMNIETLVREAVIQETPFKSEFLQRLYFSEYINFLNWSVLVLKILKIF